MRQKVFAFIKKDFLTDTSYTLAFLTRWSGIVLSIIVFYYIAQLMGYRASERLAYYGGDYFSFVLIGLALMSYLNAGINGFATSVIREQTTGTFEALLSTPIRISTLIFLFSTYNLLMGFLAFLLYIGLGYLLGAHLYFANIGTIFVIILLTTFLFLSIGIIAASCAIVFKKGDPVIWFASNLLWLFGGVYFPITIFPDALQKISFFLPSTYALRAFRLAFLKGYSIYMLRHDLLILVIFTCFLWALSLFVLRKAIWYAKKKGTVAFY